MQAADAPNLGGSIACRSTSLSSDVRMHSWGAASEVCTRVGEGRRPQRELDEARDGQVAVLHGADALDR
jgi:hypothetical protein